MRRGEFHDGRYNIFGGLEFFSVWNEVVLAAQ